MIALKLRFALCLEGSGAAFLKCLLWYYVSSSSGIASLFCGDQQRVPCYCEVSQSIAEDPFRVLSYCAIKP